MAVTDPSTETSAAVAALDDVARQTDQIKADARRRMGLDVPADAPVESLRSLFRRTGVRPYPLVALSALVVVDEFQGYAFGVLAPDVAATLGISLGGIAMLLALKTLAIAVASLMMAAWVQTRARRAAIAIASAVAWTLLTLATGLVVSIWGLALVLVCGGAATGSTRAIHQPLLLDHYPPPTRMRVLAAYRAADSLGNVLAPLAVAVLTIALDTTWRGVFIGLGLASALGTVLALRLRDPGFGRFDEELITEAIAEHDHAAAVRDDADVGLGFFEIVKRVMLVPTVRRLLAAYGILGIFLVPLMSVLSFQLEERYGLGTIERGLYFAFAFAVSIGVLAWYGRRAEDAFAKDPRRVMDHTAWLLLGGLVALIAGALMPHLVVAAVCFAAAVSAIIAITPVLSMAMFAVVPSRMRPHVAALTQIYLAGVGGMAGAVFLGGIEARFGISGAVMSMLLPAVVGAMVLRSTRTCLPADMDAMIADQIQEQEIRRLQDRGAALPMLACRGINFSYGSLQVLFDVDFTVDDGESVALLGTNGAGKSTLLRVISGTGLPDRGTVRYGGADVTYLAAERRVGLGIAQVPGGRAVFGPLSVAENLRVHGFALGRSRRQVDAAIDDCFTAFPRLAERRDQPAQTLSGGEQQMLALSKALVLRPRLLLIDELSLGLAPIIVGQLMEMVREINQRGAAVVLVEQSVNVALELAEHAYFMEKGQIRFDGATRDLIGRTDLLRAVFLDGIDAHGGDR